MDDTIIVFTSDHGESLGEHGEGTHSIFVYEATVRVPLIFRYPHKLPAGKVYRGPTRSVDIMPTVLALASKEPAETQGVDLTRALRGEVSGDPLPQYAESLHPDLVFGMAPLYSLRMDEWTYIRAPRAELYNRVADPGETRNLLEDEDSASETANERASKLDAQLEELLAQSRSLGADTEAMSLDPQTAEMLKALGYIGESGTTENFEGIDPKDAMPIFDDLNRAIAQTQAGDCPGAKLLLSQGIARAPNNVRARNTLAQCELRLGNLAAAEKHYLKSLAGEPRQPEVLMQLARVDAAQRKLDRARERAAAALDLIPESVPAMMLMGDIEVADGLGSKARRWYDRAIAVDPKRPDAYLSQADLYFRKGKFEEARGWYEKALRVAPRSGTTLMQRGLCALSLGDVAAAEKSLKEASRISPKQWRPLYALACARTSQGDADGAFEYLVAAANQGFRDTTRLQSDPCMQPLASDPRYSSFVQQLAGAQ